MFNDQLLAGRRILVTGGGTGLGKSMAARFLQLGAEVHICGRRKIVCDETATELMGEYGGSVVSHGVDIRNAMAVDEMIEAIWTSSGPLTDLINNAAGNFISRSEELSPRGFDAVANIVMHGTFYVTHAVGRRWIASKQRGNVVSVVEPRAGGAAVLWRAMRPHQWIKNGFVFVGLVFGHGWTDPGLIADALAVFASFCLASSAVYVANDIADRFAVGEEEYAWRVRNCLRVDRNLEDLFAYGGEQVARYEAQLFEVAEVVAKGAAMELPFGSDSERRAFRQLLKISGVGARIALSVLSGLSVAELAQAVTMQDTGRLTKIPGIGKKTAERLLLELKDKLGADLSTAVGVNRAPPATSDVLNALLALGYSDKEAVAAVRQLPDGIAVGDGIRQALKLLAKS